MVLRTAFLAAALATSACATLPHPWPKSAACTVARSEDAAPDARTWITLLLKGWDPATRRATSPALDCSGAQVRWDAPAALCADPASASTALPDGPITDKDVVVSDVDPAHRLVWIIVTRYAGGDALGPVAMVELGRSELRVEALGALRANPQQAKLRVVKAGGEVVLIAEGERCANQTAASCERSARLMPLVGSRFQPSRIVNAQGACLEASSLQLGREDVEKTGPGRDRRYRVDASLKATPRGLELLELVTVHDREVKAGTKSERLFRRAEGTLVLKPQGANLVADTASLWTRMLGTRD